VALVVALVEAVLTNDTRGIFFAVLALPGHVADLHRLGTNPHALEPRGQISEYLLVVHTAVKQHAHKFQVFAHFSRLLGIFGHPELKPSGQHLEHTLHLQLLKGFGLFQNHISLERVGQEVRN
jgi:hypothetical protein